MSIEPAVAEGLLAFVKEVATTVSLETLPAFKSDEIEERLNRARNQVTARWNVVLRVNARI